MFNIKQNSGIFGSTPSHNFSFNQNSANVNAFQASIGTCYPYLAVDGIDDVNTKLHCLTSMKVYESKSVEELRWEDYQINRITSTRPINSMVMEQLKSGENTSNPRIFNSAFPNFNQSSFSNENNACSKIFFNNPKNKSQENVKFNAQNSNKPVFSNNISNKPLFGGPQTAITSNLNVFGSSNQTIKNSNPQSISSINSLGYQIQTNPPMFNSFSTPFSLTCFLSTSSSVCSNDPTNSGGIFSQQSIAPSHLNGLSKPLQLGMTSSNTQSIFGGQQISNAQQGNVSIFGNSGSKTNLFGSIIQPTIAQSIVTTIVSNTSPKELFNHKENQEKILSLLSNRPYGTAKLFLGQGLKTLNEVFSSDEKLESTNRRRLAINRSNYDCFPRRFIVPRRKCVYFPNVNKFDKDLSNSMKCETKIDFFTKREDWNRRSDVFNQRPIIRGIYNDGIDQENIGNVTQIEDSYQENIGNFIQLEDSYHKTIGNVTQLEDSYQENVASITQVKYFDPKNVSNIFMSNDLVSNFSDVKLKSEFLEIEDLETIVNNLKYEDIYKKPNLCGIKLTKEGYYTLPAIDELDDFVSIGKNNVYECWIEDFSIGRLSFGSIKFPGLTNVYGLDFDILVDIQLKEISVYPDERLKPIVGLELNKKAELTLEQVWPVDKATGQVITSSERLNKIKFKHKLQKLNKKMGAKYISFTAENGVWVFEVQHFSKYGFKECDEYKSVDVALKMSSDRQNKDKFVILSDIALSFMYIQQGLGDFYNVFDLMTVDDIKVVYQRYLRVEWPLLMIIDVYIVNTAQWSMIIFYEGKPLSLYYTNVMISNKGISDSDRNYKNIDNI